MKTAIFCILFVLSASANAIGNPSTCSGFKASSGSCFLEYKGLREQRCEVCREHKSCFLTLSGLELGLCDAYVGGKSCFLALQGSDESWCEVIKEGKSCFLAFNGTDRDRCDQGDFPSEHLFWAN
jgi:hypothetical protein